MKLELHLIMFYSVPLCDAHVWIILCLCWNVWFCCLTPDGLQYILKLWPLTVLSPLAATWHTFVKTLLLLCFNVSNGYRLTRDSPSCHVQWMSPERTMSRGLHIHKCVQLDWEYCYVSDLYLPFWPLFNSIWLSFINLTNVVAHFVNMFWRLWEQVPTSINLTSQCTHPQPTFSFILDYPSFITIFVFLDALLLNSTNLAHQPQQMLPILTYLDFYAGMVTGLISHQESSH